MADMRKAAGEMTMCLAACIVSRKHSRHMKQQRHDSHECMEDAGEGCAGRACQRQAA